MVGERAESDQRRNYSKMIDEREGWTRRPAKSRNRTQKEIRDDRPRRKDVA